MQKLNPQWKDARKQWKIIMPELVSVKAMSLRRHDCWTVHSWIKSGTGPKPKPNPTPNTNPNLPKRKIHNPKMPEPIT